MPYDSLSDLPDAVQELPKHAQEIYRSAFNSAFEQYNGDEQKSHGTAWAAVKAKYKQNPDGNWVAKESAEIAMNEKLSMEDKRRLLQTAISDAMGFTRETYFWIQDIYDSEAIYNHSDQLWSIDFSIDEESKVTLGNPVKVIQQTTYTPIESLQAQYSRVVQEVGKRNASLDAARIKKIVALCQELLDREEPDEEETKEALKQVAEAYFWVRSQEATKTEDGQKYPASAFAYVPDADKPSTWKLRLWEDPDKKITRAQLGRAAAALSPGGFRGQKVQILTEDIAAVKRKIRAEYRKIDVEDEDIPKWVKEAESRELLLSYVPLTEAKLDKGRAIIDVIKPGFNADQSRYYPEEMLKRDYKVFEGMKMYADHPTETEDQERPERSIRDWVATLVEVSCDENGKVSGVAEIIEPWMMQKLASLRDKDMLSEMGVSINAVGYASKATIEDKETMVIEKLEACRSVDFVTEPGAGGVVTFYESDRTRDIDLVDLPALKERRPDLVKSIEAEFRAEIVKEAKRQMGLEEEIKAKDEQIEALTKERDDLKETNEKAIKEKAKADAQAAIKEAIDKAELPSVAKEQLLERFKDAETTDGIEEAITAEKDYIAKLAESGKVKGLGPTAPATEEEKKALRESFKKMHPDWSDEQLDTAVAGR